MWKGLRLSFYHMKNLLIVANWKANKTEEEAIDWLREVSSRLDRDQISNKKIIICPPCTAISAVSDFIRSNNLPFEVGAQDVSRFEEGAYTGEITVTQIGKLCNYAIIGHSERRKYFNETDDDVIAKAKLLIKNKISPILCISDIKQLDSYLERGKVIIDNASGTGIIFVYEPPSAISGGGAFHPEDPRTANENAVLITQKIGSKITILYGGSINPDNAALFFSLENINGGLVGQASLDSSSFISLLQKC